ncbi:putative HAD superfamily hydrolase [Piedraia hortae CBS 480.64]|uniref:Putative HAD superfamily hydrolase n=1 Tax=Piedraia hortae CBS 480.64 TaxID=1314780 RepID=A0A6A7C1S1_9PEZI|nr:putative HAD superfamily hydrolase [Piedraia hortae CBS 480.64]
MATIFRTASRARVSQSFIFSRHGLCTLPRITVPDFAFAFDIDGVLVRSSRVLPGAHDALHYLQKNRIPFILLTNGGGKSEADRVAELSNTLGVKIDEVTFVQSHTPFANFDKLKQKNKTALIVGGEGDKCQEIAKGYGFANVVTPGDIFHACPDIWPFSSVFSKYYDEFAKPLPKALYTPGMKLESSFKVDSILVFNDPRDWALDASVILDLLLSHAGYLGTLSSKNNDPTLPNNGYQQDGQPELIFSNPDLWYAASYHLPRLGQGGFRNALEGLWAACTHNATLSKTVMGKPSNATYAYAESKLLQHRREISPADIPLRTVYMVGDNTESDIKGANRWTGHSPKGVTWKSLLVTTGVYNEGGKFREDDARPTAVVKDVLDAVRWAVRDSQAG